MKMYDWTEFRKLSRVDPTGCKHEHDPVWPHCPACGGRTYVQHDYVAPGARYLCVASDCGAMSNLIPSVAAFTQDPKR